MNTSCKKLLAVVIISIIVVTSQFFVEKYGTKGAVHEYYFEIMDEKQRTFECIISQYKNKALDSTQWFEHSGDLINAVKSGDRDLALSLGQTAMKSFQLDYFVITDTEGKVFVRAHSPELYGDSIIQQVTIRNALKGIRCAEIEEGTVVKLSIRAGTPLMDKDGKIIGAISTGYVFSDKSFIDRIKNSVNADITIFSLNNKLVSTMKNDKEIFSNGKFKNLKIEEIVKDKKQSYTEFRNINGHEYISRYIPLMNSESKVVGFFSINEDIDVINLLKKKIGSLQFATVLFSIFILLIILRLIFKQRKYEKQLVFSNKRYENLTANVPGIIYRGVSYQDSSFIFEYISEGYKKIFEHELEDFEKNIENFISKIHLEDVQSFKDTSKLSNRDLISFHWVGRIVISDKIKWIKCDAIPEIQNDGSVLWDGLLVDITAQKNAENEIKTLNEELKKISFMDSLTDIFNRRKIVDIAEEEIKKASCSNSNLCIFMLDIDKFKGINDTYGHAVGDDVIKSFVDICTHTLKNSGFIGRIGGEEFLAVVPVKHVDEAKEMAEKIRLNVSETVIKSKNFNISISVSIGVAIWKDGMDLEALMHDADQALYYAKNNGRNQVKVW